MLIEDLNFFRNAFNTLGFVCSF